MSRHQEIFKLVEGLIKDHKGSEYEVTWIGLTKGLGSRFR